MTPRDEPPSDRSPLALLSERERAMLDLAREGLTDREIGTKLGLAPGTVNTYWTRIRWKFAKAGRAEIVGSYVAALAEMQMAEERQHRDVLVQEIERRKAIEAELKLSEQRLRVLFESNMFGMFSARSDGPIFDANERFLTMAGYSSEDLDAGLIDFMKMTHGEGPHDLGDYGPLEEEGYSVLLHPFEKTYVAKDGRPFHVRVVAAMTEHSTQTVTALVEDISERKEQEMLSISALSLLQSVLSMAGVTVFIWNLQTGHVQTTTRTTSNDGLPSIVELKHRDWVAKQPEVEQTRLRDQYERLLTSEEDEVELLTENLVLDDGVVTTVRAKGRIVRDGAGKPEFVVGITFYGDEAVKGPNLIQT